MGIMLGNLTVDQIEKRLQIALTDQHKKELFESWQQKAENIADGSWHCFDLPFVMVCGDKKTAEKWRDAFMTYDLSNAERFGITWEREGET